MIAPMTTALMITLSLHQSLLSAALIATELRTAGEPDEPSVHRFARTDGHPVRTLALEGAADAHLLIATLMRLMTF